MAALPSSLTGLDKVLSLSLGLLTHDVGLGYSQVREHMRGKLMPSLPPVTWGGSYDSLLKLPSHCSLSLIKRCSV